MSRPAAVSAQKRWASGECITHNERGEMIVDLYLQRALCAMMQPADFSGAFGHYDPALACRVTGCLLEYYDDVELDSLSALQFYTKCDEIIGAIRSLQVRAVSEAFRVDAMDRAAAVFREYLDSTSRAWPRSPPVDGRAQAAHGDREFVQLVGSRTVIHTGANSFPERSGSVQGVGVAEAHNGGDDAGDADGDRAHRDFDSGDASDNMPSLVQSSDDEDDDAADVYNGGDEAADADG